MSLNRRFDQLNFNSPEMRRVPASVNDRLSTHHSGAPKNLLAGLGLTPVMEELSHLQLTSVMKKPQSQSGVSATHREHLILATPQFNDIEEEVEMPQVVATGFNVNARPSIKQRLQQELHRELGDDGMFAWKLASRRAAEPFQQYSMSLLSAITEEEVLAS